MMFGAQAVFLFLYPPMGRLVRLTLFWSIIVCMAALWAWWWWRLPIDCSNPLLNRVFHAALPWSPLIVACCALLLRFGGAFEWIRPGSLVLGLLSSVMIWSSVMFWWPSDTSGASEERRLIHEIPLDGERLRAYRTNTGGATTDYGVIVQREVPIMGPFFRYQQIYGVYHQSEVDMALTPDRQGVIIRGQVYGRDTIAVVRF